MMIGAETATMLDRAARALAPDGDQRTNPGPRSTSAQPSNGRPEGGPANGRPDGDPVPEPPKQKPGEVGGPQGPEPTRFGDWEIGGRCTDF